MSDDKKDWDIELSDLVKSQMANDPEMAKALQELIAIFHQAQHGVRTGQYKTIDDALEALTGSRPEKIDDDGNPIPGASLQECMDRDSIKFLDCTKDDLRKKH